LEIGLAFVYFDYNEELLPEDVVASVFIQLIEQRNTLPPSLLLEFDKWKKAGRKSKPTGDRFTELLILCLSEFNFSKVFVVIDAFDECKEDSREDLLRQLEQLNKKTEMRIFISTRPQHLDRLQKSFPGSLQLKIEAKEDDIQKYLEKKLKPRRFKIDFNNQIIDVIKKNAHGKYFAFMVFG
jgi:hypothetical protein